MPIPDWTDDDDIEETPAPATALQRAILSLRNQNQKFAISTARHDAVNTALNQMVDLFWIRLLDRACILDAAPHTPVDVYCLTSRGRQQIPIDAYDGSLVTNEFEPYGMCNPKRG